MGLSRADYLNQLQSLLPQGSAWPRSPDAVLTKLLDGFAEEFSRIDLRSLQLLDEADPRTCIDLFADFERVLGLPNICTGQLPTIDLRRAAIVAKMTQHGGQSRAFFIALAATLGFDITITEFNTHTVMSPVNAPLCGEEWCFTWQVNAPLTTMRRFSVMSGVDEPLATWSNALLECAINQSKPAHTLVQFSYS